MECRSHTIVYIYKAKGILIASVILGKHLWFGLGFYSNYEYEQKEVSLQLYGVFF